MPHVLPEDGAGDEDGEVDDAEDAAVLADAGALRLGHDGVERRLDRVGESPRHVNGAGLGLGFNGAQILHRTF